MAGEDPDADDEEGEEERGDLGWREATAAAERHPAKNTKLFQTLQEVSA